jgi:bifunctional DNA-binding transcriptional regulator/antitoxin component of YhaV-PrlF toxin-antitoxin module
MMITAKPVSWGEVDESGRLIIPAEIATQYGLKPGAKVLFEQAQRACTARQPPG